MMEIAEDLKLHVPPGLIRKNKSLKVMDIRAEVAMRFSQIYDDIPPMNQMVIKIVTIAVCGPLVGLFLANSHFPQDLERVLQTAVLRVVQRHERHC